MHTFFIALRLTLLLAFAAPVAAASPPDEITVSGFRPLAAGESDSGLTLLNSTTVNRVSLSNFEQLVQLIPNMNLSGEASRARYLQLRGIGEREQYEGAPNPSVGFVVDDIDLSGLGGITATYDIRQAEVLRGPQSARYGSSALAGMIYLQTAQPDQTSSLQAEIGAGNADTRILGAAAGGGLTDRLSGRLSVYSYQDNGFRHNTFLSRDDTNERDELTVRGKLNWDMRGNWQALLTLLYADADNGYDAWSLANTARVQSDEPGRDEQQTLAASLRVSGPAFRGADLVSITTAADSDILFSFDADWANPTTFLPAYAVAYSSRNQRQRDTWSQELRLVSDDQGRWFGGTTDWVTGFYLHRLSEDNDLLDPGSYVDFDPMSCLPGWCVGRREVHSRYAAETAAVFVATDTRLSAALNLSFGLRWERWDADYRDRWFDNNLFDPMGVPVPVDGSSSFDPTENMLGGHVSLGYDLNDALHVYGRIARGFKAGGFNPSLAAFVRAGVTGPYGAERIAYQPEYAWNYETGLKGEWLDGRLTADVSLFYMDRDEAQLSQSDQLDNPASFIYVTSNGAAHSYGLEAVTEWQLSERLQLHGALGLLRSEIDAWGVRPAVVGRELAHAPEYTANVGATWSAASGWYARMDIRAVAAYFFDISHDQKSQNYRLVNMRLGKDWRHWSVSLWGRNILDRKYATRGFYFVNEPPYTQLPTLYTKFGDPRQVGITIKYSY